MGLILISFYFQFRFQLTQMCVYEYVTMLKSEIESKSYIYYFREKNWVLI